MVELHRFIISVCFLCKALHISIGRFTHSSNVGLYRKQVEEGKELNGENGVNLSGRQHQHSQRQEHLGITLQPPAAMPLTHKPTLKDSLACCRTSTHRQLLTHLEKNI